MFFLVSYSVKNVTESTTMEIEDIKSFHHLLDGYISILSRYNQESIEGRKFDNWNYDSQSKTGRPDRPRSKYTSAEAFNQLKKLDAIFPIYGKYFNDTKAENESSVIEVISERMQNIDGELTILEKDYSSNGSRVLTSKYISVIPILTLNLVVVSTFFICCQH